MLRRHKPIPLALVLVLGIAAGRIIGRARLLPSRKLICRLRWNFARPSTNPFHSCYSVSIRGSKPPKLVLGVATPFATPNTENRPPKKLSCQSCSDFNVLRPPSLVSAVPFKLYSN